MPKAKTKNRVTTDRFKLLGQSALSDYVTAIAWSSCGGWLVASSAAGDIVRCEVKTGETTALLEPQGESVDVLSISADGRFLAAGGQAGTVWIWRLEGNTPTLIQTLAHPRAWIDCLQWHPQYPELAFSLGRYVQLWDMTTQDVIATLNFEVSSVLGLSWHPQGDLLTVSGNPIIKTWRRQDWDDDPMVLETGAASEAIAWSPSGTYLAAGNSDRSLLIREEGNPASWHMPGFPGKVRQLAWSMPTDGTLLLASASGTSIIVWTKDSDPAVGWNPQVLDAHQGRVSAIAFQPQSLLLASAAEDGLLFLWDQGRYLSQILQETSTEFSCVVWSHSGGAIAAGDSQGNVMVWEKTIGAGQRFG